MLTYPYSFKMKRKLARVESFPEVTSISADALKESKPLSKEIWKKFEVQEHNIQSRFVTEKMRYLVVTPKRKIAEDTPILFLLHGLKDKPEDWINKANLLENYAALEKEIGDIIFVLPSSGFEGRGWYTNFYAEKGAEYEKYFIRELLKEIKTTYPNSPIGIAGFSMGGYGAYKLGLKYPEKFKVIGSISGAISLIRMSINRRVMRVFKYLYVPKFLFNDVDKAHFIKVFSSWGYRILKEDPYSLIKERIEVARKPKFYLSVGSEDKEPYLMFQQWIDVVGRLKKYKYFFKAYIYEGETHTWEYVSKDIQNFLRYFKKSIKND
jgi:S-formylglutathione hydrolase FrmB